MEPKSISCHDEKWKGLFFIMTNKKYMSFEEDNFDLNTHKKAADALTRGKARVKRARRQVAVGKVILAIVAFLIFILLFIIASAAGLIVF